MTGKKLQITIDDGPDPESALDTILAELDTRSIKAAFFNIGQEVKANPQATKKISDRGHTLGNHTWNHLTPTAASYTDDQIRKQFTDTHAEVIAAAGVTMKHWRAPRYDSQPRLAGLISGPGKLYALSHCDWNADSNDSQGFTTATQMLTKIRADIASQSARTSFRLLFHVLPHTATALKAVLDGLVADGHTLVDFQQTS